MKTNMDYKDFFFVAISFSQNNKFFLDIIKHIPHSHDVIISNVPYDTSADPLYLFVEAAHYTVGSKHITERSNREDYQIILTVSGEANVIYDDKEYVLCPNSAILIDCRKYHKYFLKKSDHWEYKHLHFKTEHPELLLNILPVFQKKCFEAITKFDKIIKFSDSPDSKISNFHYIYSALIDELLTSLLLQNQHSLINSQKNFSFNSIVQYLEEHYMEPITIFDLTEKFNYSKPYLIRRFKADFGYTPHQYLMRYRINKVFERISKGEHISTAVFKCGFNSTSSFYYALKNSNNNKYSPE